MFIRSFLYRTLPAPGTFADSRKTRVGEFFGNLYFTFYVGFYIESRDKLERWHRTRLRALSPTFRATEDGLELVSMREAARKEGIGPADAEYPTLADVEAQ